jgi:hypothetical protein
MTKNLRLALLASLAGTGLTAQAATYNQDLIIGFTVQSGNDLEYDLGAPSSITNGQTWNLSALIGGFDLSAVKWGVVGSGNPGVRTIWTTKEIGLPPTLSSAPAWTPVNSAVGAIYSLFPVAGAGQSVAPSSTLANSWNTQTIAGSLSTIYKNVYINPNITGTASNSFYRAQADNSTPVLLGTFSLATNGVVTFNTASVTPPPPPPPAVLSISRSGTTSSISFVSTNNATYTLYYTNLSSLIAPISTWPSQAGTISGDGTTKTFMDTTTDSDRVYRVGAQ